MGEVALAAGFGSVRRFNETFQQLFGRPPSALRRKVVVALPEGSAATAGVTVRLRYRPPYDWDAMRAHLAARAVEGVEAVVGDAYRRTFVHDGQVGLVEVVHLAAARSLAATIRVPGVHGLAAVVARIRRVFDLGADVVAIGAHLARDPFLAPLVGARPGLRTPGAWDGFELAVRAVLGQQVSVEAARRLAGRLTRMCGTKLPADLASDSTLAFAFPSAEQVLRADLSALGMPAARRQALTAIAQAALADPLLFQPLGSVEETVARLRGIRGVGDWTAHYIALRAAREPDAFPASDVGLLRGASGGAARSLRPEDLLVRAEQWRPWRAYAAQHLWAADAASRASHKRTAS